MAKTSAILKSMTEGGTKNAKLEDKKARYSLILPEVVLDEVKWVAEKEEVSILQVIRSFIKFGLTFYRMKERDPDTKLIIRQGDTDHVIMWF